MYMDYITTTDLRTESSQLVAFLKLGKKISLIHRSRVVAEIIPVEDPIKTFDVKIFRKFVKPPKQKKHLTDNQREKVYRKHLEEKYGKNLS